MTIVLFRAIKDGTVYQVGRSESEVWGELRKNWAFVSSEKNQWNILSEECDVPVIGGNIVNDAANQEHSHLRWLCPHCHNEHDTDVKLTEESPCLLCCEETDDEHLFLVEFGSNSPVDGV